MVFNWRHGGQIGVQNNETVSVFVYQKNQEISIAAGYVSVTSRNMLLPKKHFNENRRL